MTAKNAENRPVWYRPPPPGLSSETGLHRDASWCWHQDGVRIEHPKLSARLNAWVDRDPTGKLCVWNGVSWGHVQIEGPPACVTACTWEGTDLTLELRGGWKQTILPEALRVDEMGQLWALVRDTRLEAIFDGGAATSLAEAISVADDGAFVINTPKGATHRLRTIQGFE